MSKKIIKIKRSSLLQWKREYWCVPEQSNTTSKREQLNIARRQSTRSRDQPRVEKEVLNPAHGHASEYNYLPPLVNSSISFTIPVTREKLNCAFGNTVNLLTYINHFNRDLKRTLLILRAISKVCDLKKQCLFIIVVITSWLFHQFRVILACRLL